MGPEGFTVEWDENGNIAAKDAGNDITYTFNWDNKLRKAEWPTGNSIELKYDPDGNRVQKTVDDGTDVVVTDYLIDAYNHTGYAQVLEETEITHIAGQAPTAKRTTYTIGDDIISQGKSNGTWSEPDGWQWAVSTPQHLLYDGHGNTRQLIDSTGQTVVEDYSYDAYGVMLGGNPGSASNPSTPATNLLYTGEQWDVQVQQYYLRVRYYNPLTGLFNQIDPFAGSPQDPQSLHKYLYCHANPVNNIDSSGLSPLLQTVTTIAISALVSGLICVIIGAVDAYLGGQGVWQGFKTGFWMGALFTAAVLTLGIPTWFVIVVIGVFAAIGATESFRNDRNAQGVFRIAIGIACIALIVRTSAGRASEPVTETVSVSGARQPQNIAVNPKPPEAEPPGNRSIGTRPAQAADLAKDLAQARKMKAEDIRVNQQQVNAKGVRVGINQPDLQFTLGRTRVYVEYDASPASNFAHQTRIQANDPEGIFVGKIIE